MVGLGSGVCVTRRVRVGNGITGVALASGVSVSVGRGVCDGWPVFVAPGVELGCTVAVFVGSGVSLGDTVRVSVGFTRVAVGATGAVEVAEGITVGARGVAVGGAGAAGVAVGSGGLATVGLAGSPLTGVTARVGPLLLVGLARVAVGAGCWVSRRSSTVRVQKIARSKASVGSGVLRHRIVGLGAGVATTKTVARSSNVGEGEAVRVDVVSTAGTAVAVRPGRFVGRSGLIGDAK